MVGLAACYQQGGPNLHAQMFMTVFHPSPQVGPFIKGPHSAYEPPPHGWLSPPRWNPTPDEHELCPVSAPFTPVILKECFVSTLEWTWAWPQLWPYLLMCCCSHHLA